MRVRIAYTIDAHDRYRRAINAYYGKPGLASRADVVSWLRMHGTSMDDDVMFDYWGKVKRGEEPMPPDVTPEEMPSLLPEDEDD